VLKAFPLMRLWGTEKAKGDWSNLMWHESIIMLATMRELMKKGVPSLSIHDSLIVPASKAPLAQEWLERVFFGLTQMKPKLITHPQVKPTY
jgi:hypothetical protein